MPSSQTSIWRTGLIAIVVIFILINGIYMNFLPPHNKDGTPEEIKEIKFSSITTSPSDPSNTVQTITDSEIGFPHLNLSVAFCDTDPHYLAIIIPYRDRRHHLEKFLAHMIPKLNAVPRKYRVFVIEQIPGLPFNRGALCNIGYIVAQKAGCDYLVLHDVDMLPLSEKNTYSWPGPKPLHMITNFTRKGYPNYFGGVSMLTMEQYQVTNGFPNELWGWGGEDDILSYRVRRAYGSFNKLTRDVGYYFSDDTHERNKTHLRENLQVIKDRALTGANETRFDIVFAKEFPTHSLVKVRLYRL